MADPKIYDISPLIHEGLAVYPGDTPFSQKYSLRQSEGAHLDLSQIQTTVHLGAHTDAPIHYDPAGVGIDQRSLDRYMGQCQVIEVSVPPAKPITSGDFDLSLIHTPRVLFKTGSFPNPDQWVEDFNFLSPKLVDELATKGVVLVGIDTPSVDAAQAKVLEAHHRIAANDMCILEGIVLESISEGEYTLIALPLKISGADASPVRAVLLEAGKL